MHEREQLVLKIEILMIRGIISKSSSFVGGEIKLTN